MVKKAETPAVDPVTRFAALYAGNTRSSGRYDAKRDRGWTEDLPVTTDDWTRHLNGLTGCGVVPIQDDNSCVWAAIDIDNHDSDEDLDIGAVDRRIVEQKLPLIACRSKSGGIHVYLFLEKPQPSARIRVMMNGFALNIGHGGSEIFPKQGILSEGKEGKKNKGNWINLPYFNADKTIRYAVRDGKKLSLDEFLTLAERTRITESQLRALTVTDHPEAPPCLQHLFAHGVAQGHRNEALYNIVVYYRKKNDGKDFEGPATDANQSVFSRPLPRAEMQRTISSAGRSDMQYRCNEEPIRSLCQRDICLNRKFGITPADADRLATVEAIPPFTDLTKYISEPVRWDIKIDGVQIRNLATEHLLDWRMMRQVIAERLTRVVPMIKNQEWERMLAPLMKEARTVETPDDASTSGVIRERLKEFASKTDVTNKGEDADDRKALIRGLPVVAAVDGERCVIFRGQDFINYLKRTKSEELKGINLWMAVKDMGVTKWRCRPGAGQNLNPIDVWTFPVKLLMEHLQPMPKQEFKSEL